MGEPPLVTQSEAATITSTADLMSVIGSTSEANKHWFRGQVDSSWKLLPSTFRNRNWIERESDMLKEFRREVPGRSQVKPGDEWEWLCLAQHHRLPTRLLDWSTNPLVALFFATQTDDGQDGPSDGAFFMLDPRVMNRVSTGNNGVLLLGSEDFLRDYLPSEMSKTRSFPVAVIAQQFFGRIEAQSGVFTLSHRLDPVDLEHTAGFGIRKFVVPLISKEKIRVELDSLNIHPASIFLDLDEFAMRIREDYS